MYTLTVENSQVQSESGFFFKARPFTISVGDRTFMCVFKKGSQGKVVYSLEEKGVVLVELQHPYYTPEFAPEETTRFGEDAPILEAVYGGLLHLGVAKEKTWLHAYQEKKVSFQITQS